MAGQQKAEKEEMSKRKERETEREAEYEERCTVKGKKQKCYVKMEESKQEKDV